MKLSDILLAMPKRCFWLHLFPVCTAVVSVDQLGHHGGSSVYGVLKIYIKLTVCLLWVSIAKQLHVAPIVTRSTGSARPLDQVYSIDRSF